MTLSIYYNKYEDSPSDLKHLLILQNTDTKLNYQLLFIHGIFNQPLLFSLFLIQVHDKTTKVHKSSRTEMSHSMKDLTIWKLM